jgi:hypothetical protein
MNREECLKLTNFVLLLTAAIDIKGMKKAYPKDPKTRERDYISSLNYYIQNHPKVRKIVFVENSGWPLDLIKQACADNPHGKEVEFISLNINDFPREYGKGFGEISLIDMGIKQSRLAKSSSHIGKITGRIRLLNLTNILTRIELNKYKCIFDVKDQGWFLKKYVLREKFASPYADTRFLIFEKSFYLQYFQPRLLNHDAGVFYMEREIFNAIEIAKESESVLNRFPIEPNFSGIAGHFLGKNYDGLKEMVKYYVRSFFRKILPFIHL